MAAFLAWAAHRAEADFPAPVERRGPAVFCGKADRRPWVVLPQRVACLAAEFLPTAELH